ncbi:sensor histidine kinase [Cyanobium sp. N.Huapi 1H5]|uniref:sensor histidine kinase n=1 Tax=Cyanobium sp. N.Huapi 1H5 TaxID=2823719 RepID=UPI0020CC315B|nr:HAMP domain-containing sensor histidine kinase [Cyanobium sp. N.Huapi 1H5]MCP9838752.1 sensor histidine kinase [Cyanobium sp. N.Huapi 1H5]
MAVLLAGLLGLALGWLLARRTSRPGLSRSGLSHRQLLRWIGEAPDGWLILDSGDRIQLINQRAERLLEAPGAGLRRQEPLDRLCRSPELLEVVRNARRRERPQRLDWELGEQQLAAFVLPGDDGWVALLLQSRRSLEAQLEQQERWVSDVAHELKTPLTALLLVGDSLAAHVNDANVVLVERLQRELLRLQWLVGDLMELSRLENTLPEGVRLRSRVDLPQLVQQVWLGLRPLAERRSIRLELIAEGELAVLGDGSRLHRALLNLLDNALRYSPEEGTVWVEIEATAGWCLLSVRDEGPGLSEDDLEHMFERFYRGDPSRVRSDRGGSGLGLAIVQQIAVTHGGRIQASNHPGGGAVMELLLPAVA